MKQRTAVNFKGLSTFPSDYMAEDGELAMCHNVENAYGELRPILHPEMKFMLSSGYTLKYIHDMPMRTAYILENNETHRMFYVISQDDKTMYVEDEYRELEEQPNDGQGYSTAQVIKNVGNILVVSFGGVDMYYRYKAAGYAYIGSGLPELPVIKFGNYSVAPYIDSSYTSNKTHFLEPILKHYGITDADIRGTLDFSQLKLAGGVTYDPTSSAWSDYDKHVFVDGYVSLLNAVRSAFSKIGAFAQPYFVRYGYRMYDESVSKLSPAVLITPCTKRNLTVWGHIHTDDDEEHGINKGDVTPYPMRAVAGFLYHAISRVPDLSEWDDIIKSVDIFVSPAIYTIDESTLNEGTVAMGGSPATTGLGELYGIGKTYGAFSWTRAGAFGGAKDCGVKYSEDDIDSDMDSNGGIKETLFYIQDVDEQMKGNNSGDTTSATDNDFSGGRHRPVFIEEHSNGAFFENAKMSDSFYLVSSIPVKDLSVTPRGRLYPVKIEKHAVESVVSNEMLEEDYLQNYNTESSNINVYNKRLIKVPMLRDYSSPFTADTMSAWLTNKMSVGSSFGDDSYATYKGDDLPSVSEDTIVNYIGVLKYVGGKWIVPSEPYPVVDVTNALPDELKGKKFVAKYSNNDRYYLYSYEQVHEGWEVVPVSITKVSGGENVPSSPEGYDEILYQGLLMYDSASSLWSSYYSVTEVMDTTKYVWRSFYVELRKDTETIMVGIGEAKVPSDVSQYYNYWLSYPDPDAKNLYMLAEEDAVSRVYYKIPLVRHDALQCAYWLGTPGESDTSSWRRIEATLHEDGSDDVVSIGSSKISVQGLIQMSEVNNPFTFPSRLSSAVGNGTILAIAASTLPISEGQQGQFPLMAFTTEGIWALQISESGSIVATNPMLRDVLVDKDAICLTEDGIIYATSRGLKLLRGRESECISDAIDDSMFEFDKMPGFGSASGLAANASLMDIGKVSKWIYGCRMAYAPSKRRVYVVGGNEDWPNGIALSLNLDSMSWSTIDYPYREAVNAYPTIFVQKEGDEGVEVYDVDNDNGDGSVLKPALVVTRPMKFAEYGDYKTVRDVFVRGYVDADKVKTILYGSCNWKDWCCVASSIDSHICSISGSAYRSYRVAIIMDDVTNEGVSLSAIDFGVTPKYTNKIR